jgi:hypothetical protein
MTSSLLLPIHDMFGGYELPFLYGMVDALILEVIVYVMIFNCHEFYLGTLLITLSFSCYGMDGG